MVFVLFFLFCIISLSVHTSPLTLSLEGMGRAFITPFQKGYNGAQQNVRKLWAGFTELGDVRDQLRLTREKLQHYEAVAEEVSEIKKENDRLRKLLDMQKRVTNDSIAAIIISKDPDNWFRTIVVNRGSSDGVRINMPVIAYVGEEKAVAGKVVEVRGSVSVIEPIISTGMKLGVMLQESRFPGLLSGYAANSNFAIIDYINKSAAIKLGDVVVTSGQGGIFPQGMLVGKVIKSFVSESSPYQRAIVAPIVNYNQIEEVFIIKKEPDKELMEVMGKVEP